MNPGYLGHYLTELDPYKFGGPGSGNRGHKGVPGERGGSAPGPGASKQAKREFVIKVAKAKLKKLQTAPVEHAIGFDKDGNQTFEVSGTVNSCAIPAEHVAKLKDNVFIHNHPEVECTFSSQDIVMAQAANPSDMLVITKGNYYHLERPATPNGWYAHLRVPPPPEKEFSTPDPERFVEGTLDDLLSDGLLFGWLQDRVHDQTRDYRSAANPRKEGVSAADERLAYRNEAMKWIAETNPVIKYTVTPVEPKKLAELRKERNLYYNNEDGLSFGGSGSGNWGHSGRPGERGGSAEGEGPSVPSASDIAKLGDTATQAIAKNGGVTINIKGYQPSYGWMVSPHKDREKVIKTSALRTPDVVEYIAQNLDLLTEDEEHYIGGWSNPEDGQTYLDISIRAKSEAEGRALGKKHGQKAIYCLHTGETIDVKDEPDDSGAS